jgi:hypothetical protein
MSFSLETKQYAEPFFATVDAALIRNASSFFDNSDTSIVRELLQNSRRSGATRVSLRRNGQRWIYSDDGPGCEPQELLGLGTSNWTQGVKEAETPAGCGFFALARRNPLVSCPQRGWFVELTGAHFNGQLPVNALPGSPTGSELGGMVIEFDIKQGAIGTHSELRDLAKYMPFEFSLDGELQESRLDFLNTVGARPESFRRVRISEHVEMVVSLGGYADQAFTICYHGHVVRTYSDMPTFTTCQDKYHARARVMVTRESELPLELPQRNSVIKGEALAALLKLARCTALEIAADMLAQTSTTSPTLWLKARREIGYTGPVLYPKFIGQRLLRHEGNDISDHSIAADGEVRRYAYCGAHITFDEFEADGFLMAPDKDILALLAQTPIPCHKAEVGSHWVSDLDTDDYFAVGLRLVRELESLAHLDIPHGCEEGKEWFDRLRRLKQHGHDWHTFISVIAAGKTKGGKPLTFSTEFSTESGRLDEENLYDSIRLEFNGEEDDTTAKVFDMPALFDIAGNSSDTRVNFILTQDWLDTMPPGFPSELGEAVAEHRKFHERDSDEDDVDASHVAEELREKFLKFADDPDTHYQEKLLEAAIDAAQAVIYKLTGEHSGVVVEIPFRGRNVLRGAATCRFLPVFVPYYKFEGSHGLVDCDERGERDPDSDAYPEYSKFDVATMKQLGMKPGHWDILEACGWDKGGDFTAPEMGHLVGALIEFAGEPPHVLEDAGTLDGLVELLDAGRISSNLWTWLWYTHNEVAKQAASHVHPDLLPVIKPAEPGHGFHGPDEIV